MFKSNEEILVTVVGSALVMFVLAIIVIIAIIKYKAEQKEGVLRMEHLRIEYDQEILRTQLEVQNSTLQLVGQELHDNLGQLLSVAKINLSILQEMELIPQAQSYVDQTNDIVTQSIIDMRSLTKSLDGDFVKDFGIEANLSNELIRIGKTKRFKTNLVVQGAQRSLGYEKEIVLFRICQEALNNVIKHAQADQITCILDYGHELFSLQISDNGNGFLIEGNLENIELSGAGLRNIRRRAELIKGKLSIKSEINSGTEIQITVGN